MAKITETTWARAKALFEAQKSFREIEKDTGINYKTVEYRSKTKGWVRGALSRQIEEQARVEADFITLESSQREVVREEVDRINEARKFYTSNARKVAQVSLHALSIDRTPQNASITMQTLEKGMKVEGVVPYYPNQPVINNTNAQQNKVSKVVFEVVD